MTGKCSPLPDMIRPFPAHLPYRSYTYPGLMQLPVILKARKGCPESGSKSDGMPIFIGMTIYIPYIRVSPDLSFTIHFDIL